VPRWYGAFCPLSREKLPRKCKKTGRFVRELLLRSGTLAFPLALALACLAASLGGHGVGSQWGLAWPTSGPRHRPAQGPGRLLLAALRLRHRKRVSARPLRQFPLTQALLLPHLSQPLAEPRRGPASSSRRGCPRRLEPRAVRKMANHDYQGGVRGSWQSRPVVCSASGDGTVSCAAATQCATRTELANWQRAVSGHPREKRGR
jgi:hypothetical protein